jgi:ParB family chromosome partitioning protein
MRVHNEQALEELMASISDTKGLITPLVVRPIGSNEYEIVAGHTRYLACQRLGYPDIPAIVRPMSEAEAAKALAADNMARTDLSDYEIYKHLSDLFQRGFLASNSEAARLLGRSRQDIIRYKCFGLLPPTVIELLETNRNLLGSSAAQALTEYPAELVLEACQKLLTGKLGTQQALLSWLKQGTTEKPPRQDQPVRDSTGKSAGRILRSDQALKVAVRGVDYGALEKVMQEELERQGFRL